MSEQEGDKAKKPHLTPDDYRILVSWMEDDENRSSINGTSSKTRVGGKVKSRTQGFTDMAAHLARVTNNKALELLPARNMQQRWETYEKKHAKAKRLSKQTGWGLTQAERERGMTIQDKLDHICPHFARMDSLIGKKANKNPAATVELGVPAAISGVSDRRAEEHAADTADSRPDSSPHEDDNEAGETTDWHSNETMRNGDSTTSSRWDEEEATTQCWQTEEATTNTDHAPRIEFSISSDSEYDDDKSAAAVVSLPSSPLYAGQGPQDGATSTTATSLFTVNESTIPIKDKVKRTTAQAPATKKPTSKRATEAPLCAPRPATKKQKQQPPNASETRMSLSTAYAKNSEAKVAYFRDKLEADQHKWRVQQKEAKRQWEAQQATNERKFHLQMEQRAQEAAEREKVRKQEMMLELIRQGKAAAEIEAYFRLLGTG